MNNNLKVKSIIEMVNGEVKELKEYLEDGSLYHIYNKNNR